MDLISVIVPVYNTEKYLERCIKSIINQSYKDLEIVLINDGSTDNSLAVCNTFAEKDKRIKVYSFSNAGVSHARNFGIQHAHGEYIYFVDSDDEVENDGIQKMVDSFESNCEFVIAGYNEIEPNENFVKKTWGQRKINKYEAMNSVLDENGVGGYLWNKLFRSTIIKKNNLKFDDNIYVWEDVLFVMQYLVNCENIQLISDSVYKYCRRTGSAVEFSKFTPKLYSQIDAIQKIQEITYSNKSLHELLEYRKIRCCLGLLRSMGLGKEIDKGHVNKICNVLNNVTKKTIRSLSLTDKVSYLLVKIHPVLFIKIYCLVH